MDYLDVVVHIFTPETREFYRLEQLWGEAPARAASGRSQLITDSSRRPALRRWARERTGASARIARQRGDA